MHALLGAWQLSKDSAFLTSPWACSCRQDSGDGHGRCELLRWRLMKHCRTIAGAVHPLMQQESRCLNVSLNQMATSLLGNLQYPIHLSGSNSGDPYIKSVKNLSAEGKLASSRWLGSTKVLLKEPWRNGHRQRQGKGATVSVFAVMKDMPDDEDSSEDDSSQDKVNAELFRQQMEKMISNDAEDARFEGKDLAQLIRNKYGRSYDVQLIKKEFMGRQLLAMNVMWKYREQRSFPLTEEEYLLHLDYIAQNLRGWGAVSYVRDSLEKTRERPRIGKAVSIFINPDESGERAREWINR